MRLSTIIIAAAALAGSFATANAVPASAVQAGLLECRGGQNVGFVVGSVTSLDCVFQSPGHRPEAYVATVRRIGVDLGVTAQTQFSRATGFLPRAWPFLAIGGALMIVAALLWWSGRPKRVTSAT